jgi:tetratricopeptide (TPR) repeat protein
MNMLRPVVTVAITALLTHASARAVGQERSWVSQEILPTKPTKEIKFTDRIDGQLVHFPFAAYLPVFVKEERQGWLRIGSGRHREAWVAKADFVLALDAPDYCQLRIQANPKDAWAWCMRGLYWVDKREPDNAIKDLDECIRLDPNVAGAFFSRGVAWFGKGDFDKAIKDYDEAIRLDAKDAWALHARGNAWRGKRELDKAINDYDEAIRLDAKDSWFFFDRAGVWLTKKELDKAIKDYGEAIRLDPKNFGSSVLKCKHRRSAMSY